MARPIGEELGRRERQIMNVVYRLGRATVGDVMAQPVSYTHLTLPTICSV